MISQYAGHSASFPCCFRFERYSRVCSSHLDGLFVCRVSLCAGPYRRAGDRRSCRRHTGTGNAGQDGARDRTQTLFVGRDPKKCGYDPRISGASPHTYVWPLPFLCLHTVPFQLSFHCLWTYSDGAAQACRAFFIGRAVSYSFWGLTASNVASRIDFESTDALQYFSVYFVAAQIVLLSLIYVFTRVDWRTLLAEKNSDGRPKPHRLRADKTASGRHRIGFTAQYTD